ncbi:MAG: hypothetical protein R3Y63_05730 [Eubacteriales bacterium]
MDEKNKSAEEQFFSWLSTKVSAVQLSDLYMLFPNIEAFGYEAKILKQPLLETKSLSIIRRLKALVDTNKQFRTKHRGQLTKIQIAMNYYYDFLKEYHPANHVEEHHQDLQREVAPPPVAITNEETVKKVLAHEVEQRNSEGCEIMSSQFQEWLISVKKLADRTDYAYASAVSTCERIGKTVALTEWKLYGSSLSDIKRITNSLVIYDLFVEANRTRHNQLTAALNSFITCVETYGTATSVETTEVISIGETNKTEKAISVSDEEYTSFLAIFEESFTKGFRLNSNIHMKRFLNSFNQKHQTVYSHEDVDITSKIVASVTHAGIKIYPVATLLDEETKEKVLSHIAQSFLQGIEVIYYQALFREFDQLLLDQRIYDAKILQGYLRHECAELYNFNAEFFSKEAEVEVDLESKLKDILLSYEAPVKKEELYRKTSNFLQDLVDKILKQDEFINNTSNEYFYISSIDFTPQELEKISNLIQIGIDERKYISHSELTELIEAKYPSLLERFAQYSETGLRSAISVLLRDKFSFNGKIISDLENHLSKQEIFTEFIQSKSSFNFDEISSFAKEMDVVFSYETLYSNSLRIDQDQFVSKSDENFDVEQIDAAIGTFCTGDYIPLRGVTSFASLPYADFLWNHFLLEHYIAEYSREFFLLHAGFTSSSCAGAIVKKTGNIKDFDQLLGDVLFKNNIELNEENALEYLFQNGYLARRRYTAISQIITKVKLQKG